MNETRTHTLLQRLITFSAQETMDFGNQFAQRLQPGDLLAFSGNLGSGKSTCIRGVCAGLQVTGVVTSPTFTLINEYTGRLPIFHFDFYRIHHHQELHDMGVEEYFHGEGICLVEWPEVVQELLPVKHYSIHLYHSNEKEFEHYHKDKLASRYQNMSKQEEDSIQLYKSNLHGAATQFAQTHRLIEVYQNDRIGN